MSERAHTGRKSGKDHRKLKNFIINPWYQMKYIFWLTISGVLLLTMVSGIFFSYINENYTILVDLSPMTDEAKVQLYHELNVIIVKLGLISLFFLFVIGLLGLLFSHRTAGPLYHFKRVFNEIKNGNRDARIKLRPDDDFQDVAIVFNEMMDSLKK